MTRTHKQFSDAFRLNHEQHRNEVRFRAPGWDYGYIADIYLARRRAVVEVDGPSHYGREWRDRIRDTKFRKDLGLRTFRITNREIERDPGRAARKVLYQLNRSW
jgi:very-short-patch-repair endonuclease